MKKTRMSFITGFLVAAVLFGGLNLALNAESVKDVIMDRITIVLNGKTLQPKDANGNTVRPLLYNGTTYLPVRAIAEALNMPVYWEQSNKTIYAGNMDGTLPRPTVKLEDMKSEHNPVETSAYVHDNQGGVYEKAVNGFKQYEFNIGKKYSKLKGTLVVPEGLKGKGHSYFKIAADSNIVYTSPRMSKDTKTTDFDVKIKDYNVITFIWESEGDVIDLKLVNTGFYQ